MNKIEYKYALRCKICKRKYGSDFKGDNGICPICHEKCKGNNSRFIEDKKLSLWDGGKGL